MSFWGSSGTESTLSSADVAVVLLLLCPVLYVSSSQVTLQASHNVKFVYKDDWSILKFHQNQKRSVVFIIIKPQTTFGPFLCPF